MPCGREGTSRWARAVTSRPVDPSTSSFTFQIAPSDAFEGFEHDEHPKPKAWFLNVILATVGFLLVIEGVAGVMLRKAHGLRWSDIGQIVLGVGIDAFFLIRPLLRELRARAYDRRPLTVTFDSSGAKAALDGHKTRTHPWSRLERVQTG